ILLLAAAAVWLYSRLMRASAAPRPEKVATFQALAGVAVHAPIFLSIFVLLSGTPFSAAAQGLWLWLPVMSGSAIAMAGIARRVGESLHCPNCEYEFAFNN